MWSPGTTTVKITVGGVDVSAYVPLADGGERNLPGLSIEQVMGRAIDSCAFSVENGAALGLQEWDEIRITNEAETEVYFGGFVTRIDDRPIASEVDLVCAAQDYTVLLDRALINQEWDSAADTTVLADMRANASPALTDFDFSTHVNGQNSVSAFRVSRQSVRDALDRLAAMVGADWYVDYDKKLHWYARADVAATYDISDSPDFTSSFPAEGLQRTRDGMGIANHITIVGGAYLSEDVTHVYAGDGTQVRFVVPHRYHAMAAESSVIVEKNTGTDASPVWSAASVGIKYLNDSDGYDVLFSFVERFFEFATAPANLTQAWRVRARYEAPLRVVVTSSDSYARYGRWFTDVLIDASITDKSEARMRGKAALASSALATVFRFSVYEPGLRAGDVLRIVDATLGADDDYLIQRLTMTFPGGGAVRYGVEAGDYLPDLAEMMREIARLAAGEVEWREDEVLDELLLTQETLTATESTPTVAEGSWPYYYSDDAALSFEWGFGAYYDSP